VGRHARLELVFDRRGGRTVIADAYAEPPLRIGRVFDLDDAVYLILVCTGPGVFAGDRLHHRISVASGARAVLVSQAALQIHPSREAAAAFVHHEYRIGEDAELVCHWDPVVPFAGARLVQHFDLDVARTGRVYWSDALMSGRVGRGEAWEFESIDHELRFAVEGAVKYLERASLVPAGGRPDRAWIAGDAHYIGTSLVYHEAASPEWAETLHRDLAGIVELTAAVDLADARLIIGRLLATNGVAFSRGRTTFRQRVLEMLFNSPHLMGRR
jgi:urease accessory protein UreH